MNNTSFSIEVKYEILAKDMNKEQAIAFIYGLKDSASIKRDKDFYVFKFNNSYISKQIRDLLAQLNIFNIKSKKNRNWILIDLKELQDDFQIKRPSFYFAGIFVGGGSISNPSSTSYHLEIQFYYLQKAKKVKLFLDKYSFSFSIIQRRKKWVIYIKKSELIADFLRAIEASLSLIKFEDKRIERDYRNHINRYSNLDIHNQDKLSKASIYHLKNYQYIIDNNLLHHFKKEELIFFELKKLYPYSSLSELVDKLKSKEIIKTKSGLNHWLIKLRKFANE